ncbi:TIGR01548 family HAD-type hydrolase [Lyngbya confervoides]|uniref:TIGR01548 family HAD-type hydrolase n=1 Tax=Lyngbya confervoides BDU141951 TaxID=1574623 RepID=A0ABD4T3N9_9CYAN|nr:TIGR01548 family HAD-type hydrolase [Lyngbya confervoides]MCM1982930.1 TIGR01548 family HAD-type hydrolase [Lyngbya confervoides BDU141951]
MDQPVALIIFDIDGVVRDVAQSYRRAIADTVEHFTAQQYRPTMTDIDALKAEGLWNNDWKASQELIYRHYEGQGRARESVPHGYDAIVDYFQGKYRGQAFSGYIKDEPLLMSAHYLEQLQHQQIGWGFFSGATRGSACYVLESRLGINSPPLVAMEDAPGKPDPQGLFQTVTLIESQLTRLNPSLNHWESVPIFYVGDTAADMKTAENAQQQWRDRPIYGIGVVPPHAWENERYGPQLLAQGAKAVVQQVEDITAPFIQHLLASPA